MIPPIPMNKLRETIDFISHARRGRVEKLPLGSAAYWATDKAVLASNGANGTAIFRPEYSYTKTGVTPSANFRVDTFIVCLRKRIRYDQMSYLNVEIDKLARQFASVETNEVLKRIKAVDDVVYADGDEEVARLQKFFDDLKRPVAVLPSGKIIDMGDNFTLVVRTDLCVEVFDDPLKLSADIALWEDIGFFCDVN